MIYNPKALESFKTISTSQCCDLKIEVGDTRVWLCRVGGGVTEERRTRNGKWRWSAGGCVKPDAERLATIKAAWERRSA